MKQDMERFKEMCKEGLLGAGDYGLFKHWLAIDGLREAYIRIRDGLVLEGEIQEMNSEENIYNDGPYQARVCGFFLGVPPGGCLLMVALVLSDGIGASLRV
jgi:hypothetical protein